VSQDYQLVGKVRVSSEFTVRLSNKQCQFTVRVRDTARVQRKRERERERERARDGTRDTMRHRERYNERDTA
jgi:hypothetical protein